MMLHRNSVLACAFAAWVLVGSTASAQTVQSVFFDDFESFSLGTLDKNDPTGPNQAANGVGNPWFGPEPGGPNLVVVGSENGVLPHSGQQMLRGLAPIDFDQDWYNLAFRLNNGSPFTQNVILDWWFYDPIDPNNPNTGDPGDYFDYVALGFYDSAPADRDGPDGRDPPNTNYNLNRLFTQIQRISLGAGPKSLFGFDPTVYQARVVGSDDGLANGWFNTTTPRSVGWHHGMIAIGPLLDDGTNDVTFFIDDLTTPTLAHNSQTAYGYNVIELNSNFGPVTGYYDDVNFSVVTP